MKLEAIIFDMDGVLADSETMWNEIDAAMLALYDVVYKGEHKHDVLGKTTPTALKFYCEKFGIRTDLETMALRRREIAMDFYANRIPLFEVTPRVLAELSAKLPLGLATSSISDLVFPFLERHDIRKYLKEVTTGDELERSKPFPDIYLKAAEKLGVAPENCLVVEDAMAGVHAGKAAGMTVAAIPDPRFVDVTLFPSEADYILEKLEELLGLVEKLSSRP